MTRRDDAPCDTAASAAAQRPAAASRAPVTDATQRGPSPSPSPLDSHSHSQSSPSLSRPPAASASPALPPPLSPSTSPPPLPPSLSASTAQSPSKSPSSPPSSARADQRRRLRRRCSWILALLAAGLGALGLMAGSDGLSWRTFQADLAGDQAALIIGQIRAPRTLGALLVGALLGLAGAVSQGMFRNPLADPFLLGSAAGASLAVVAVLAASALGGHLISLAAAAWLERLGLVLAAFGGAVVGVGLTLVLARGAQHTLRLLLSGVVVGVLLGALTDLLTVASPEALRGKQMFLLGSTGYLGWSSVLILAVGLAVALPLALRLARVLDALTLGDESAASLGLPLARLRLVLVLLFALATGLAVSQAGLVAFVGLVAPHLVRRLAPGPHGPLLLMSTATGGVLLLGADVLARVMLAPQELPVGLITAVVGGVVLMGLLHRQGRR